MSRIYLSGTIVNEGRAVHTIGYGLVWLYRCTIKTAGVVVSVYGYDMASALGNALREIGLP